MNRRLLYWAITSALAGFLFGFDTVVISGAEQRIQALWHLSPAVHGVALAAALYGTVIGSLTGGFPADRFGRKPTLLWVGVLYIVSAIGSRCLSSRTPAFFAAVSASSGIGSQAPKTMSSSLARGTNSLISGVAPYRSSSSSG